MRLPELPPEAFTLGNYGFHIPFSIYLDNNMLIPFLIENNISAIQEFPSYRYREDCVAAMFYSDEEERWTHIPKYILEPLEEALYGKS